MSLQNTEDILPINRYEINYVGWHGEWDRLKKRFSGCLDEVEEIARKEIALCAKFVPPESIEKSKSGLINSKEDPFWAQALYFAGQSIYDAKVYRSRDESAEVCYEATVDNGCLFPFVLHMDFLISLSQLEKQFKSIKLLLHIHPGNKSNDLQKNPFYTILGAIEHFFPKVIIESDSDV